MKFYLSISALLLISSTISASAIDRSGLYGSLKLGLADVEFKSSQVHTDSLNGFKSSFDPNSLNFNGTKSVMPLSVAVGYNFFNNMRTELEYTYATGEQGGADVSSNIFLNNIYYDFNNSSNFTPFISGGIGTTHLKSTIKSNSEISAIQKISHDSFSWSVGVGAIYKVTEQVSLELAYRYIDLGKFDYQMQFDKPYYVNFYQTLLQDKRNKQDVKLTANEFSLGLLFNF